MSCAMPSAVKGRMVHANRPIDEIIAAWFANKVERRGGREGGGQGMLDEEPSACSPLSAIGSLYLPDVST